MDLQALAAEAAGGLSNEELARRREEWQKRRQERRQPELTPEQQDKIMRYAAGLFAPRRPASITTRLSFSHEMSYQDARVKFWEVLRARAEQISILKGREFNFVFSPEQAQVVGGLLKYFVNDPSSPFQLNKGIFLYGMPGTGKTEIMTAFCIFCKEYRLTKAFEWAHMPTVYQELRASGSDKEGRKDPISFYSQFNRMLDEFARITGPVLVMGNPIDPNEALIESRYIRFEAYGQITHITANAAPNEVAALLTPAVLDRLRAMCTGVKYPGQTKRQ